MRHRGTDYNAIFLQVIDVWAVKDTQAPVHMVVPYFHLVFTFILWDSVVTFYGSRLPGNVSNIWVPTFVAQPGILGFVATTSYHLALGPLQTLPWSLGHYK